jgi:type III pantothenate kinase
MDRLMGAVAADRLRTAGRAAIIADLGTAIKVHVVSDAGAFMGGAILPGLAMSARALDEQTDALPRVNVEQWEKPPVSLGKATVPAIESGLFWGAVGAIRELVGRLSQDLPPHPELFVTGGGSKLVAEVLSQDEGLIVRHVPHLVLSGIALVDTAGN